MSLVGSKYIRFEDIIYLKQCLLFEKHKVYRWRAKSILNSAFGLPEDSFRNE